MIKLYRDRAITASAVQWTGDNLVEVVDFIGKREVDEEPLNDRDSLRLIEKRQIRIPTTGGHTIASVGDFIVKDTNNFVYAVKADAFAKAYIEAEDQHA